MGTQFAITESRIDNGYEISGDGQGVRWSVSESKENEPVNLDSSGVIELGRLAVSQSKSKTSDESSVPEFSGRRTRCSTQERELLSGQFDAETFGDQADKT
mgnify:CR=1 FL=1